MNTEAIEYNFRMLGKRIARLEEAVKDLQSESQFFNPSRNKTDCSKPTLGEKLVEDIKDGFRLVERVAPDTKPKCEHDWTPIWKDGNLIRHDCKKCKESLVQEFHTVNRSDASTSDRSGEGESLAEKFYKFRSERKNYPDNAELAKIAEEHYRPMIEEARRKGRHNAE